MNSIRQSLSPEGMGLRRSSKPATSLKSAPAKLSNVAKRTVKKLTETPIGSMLPTGESSDRPFFNTRSASFWVIVVVLLAFLGFNIFKYLSEGTDFFVELFRPILRLVGYLTGQTAKTTIDAAATGSKKIVSTSSDVSQDVIDVAEEGTNTGIDVAAKVSTSGIDLLERNLTKNKPIVVNPDNADDLADNTDDAANPEPVRSSSQNHGFCYVGKSNNVRTCAKVSGRAECMSGDIYPTLDLCVNPNLRG